MHRPFKNGENEVVRFNDQGERDPRRLSDIIPDEGDDNVCYVDFSKPEKQIPWGSIDHPDQRKQRRKGPGMGDRGFSG